MLFQRAVYRDIYDAVDRAVDVAVRHDVHRAVDDAVCLVVRHDVHRFVYRAVLNSIAKVVEQ
jgi:hypothetical protein